MNRLYRPFLPILIAGALIAAAATTSCATSANDWTSFPRPADGADRDGSLKGATSANYWTSFPHPKTLYVTGDWNAFPSLARGKDPGGLGGDMAYAVESLAGLAALASKEGRNDSLIWIGLGVNAPYDAWLSTVFRVTRAKRVDVKDPMQLIQQFARRGIVKGYILYRADHSQRSPYEGMPGSPGYSSSVNAATSMAPILGGILVEENAEPAFKALGLKCLADLRDKDEQWFFNNYRGYCSRSIVHTIDPKVIHNRSYCIATRSLCIYGVNSFTDRVYQWLEPNSPVMGWNGDDEYKDTSQVSRWAKFNMVANWCMNMTVISTVRAEIDIPWSDLRLNKGSNVNPLSLTWDTSKHYTAFILSDGDNLQWVMGNFTHHPFYWASPDRGAIPFGWTVPVDALSKAAVPTLDYLARTSTPNDTMIMAEAGGYVYHDEYARNLPNSGLIFEQHADQFAGSMNHLGVHLLFLAAGQHWDSPEARDGCQRIAGQISGLDGIFVSQYYPYNAGHGALFWVRNHEGEPIPVLSLRYSIWTHQRDLPDFGPPAYIASRINQHAHAGPSMDTDLLDWTMIHAWSSFQKADTSKDLWTEEIDPNNKAAQQKGVGGFEPALWAAKRLDSQVKVVSPEELVWRIRLTLKTRETLDGIALRFLRDPALSHAQRQRLDSYHRWLQTAPLNSDAERREAFVRLRVDGGEV